VHALVGDAAVVATSAVTYAETRAALAQPRREGAVTVHKCIAAKREFEQQWPSFLILDATDALCRTAGEWAERCHVTLVVSNDDSSVLIVATNVLVYYTPLEQALAAANIAAMLRPDGIFLSNNDVPLIAAMKPSVGQFAVRYSERQNDGVFVYQRR
jgi:hypothetical protein